MTSLVHRSSPCSLFTVALVHRRQILPKLHRLAVPRFKALTCPSPLQPVHQAKPCLDLLHFGHITPCHVSYAMSSSITLYEYSNLFGPSILTLLALHHCLGPSSPNLAQASPPRGPSLQSLDLPFSIATGPSSQALS